MAIPRLALPSTIRRPVVSVTTDENGDAVAYTPPIYGEIESISYVKTDFDNGSGFVLSTEDSEITLWSEEDVDASATRHPRDATVSGDAAAALYAYAGQAVNSRIAIGGERVKIVIANGGDTKSGVFHITVAD